MVDSNKKEGIMEIRTTIMARENEKLCPVCKKQVVQSEWEKEACASATVYHGECLEATINTVVLQRRFKATLNPAGFFMYRGGHWPRG